MIKNNFDEVYYPENLSEILYKNVDEKMIDHIKRANIGFSNDISMSFMGFRISYKELFENIEKYSKSLKKYGLSKGDCIALAMPNVPETVYYFYACNEIGVTAYLMDPRSSFDNMIKCIKESNSKLFVCEMGTYYSKVANNIDKLPLDNVIVSSPLYTLESNKSQLNGKQLLAAYLYELKRQAEEIKLLSKNNSKKLFQHKFLRLSEIIVKNMILKFLL